MSGDNHWLEDLAERHATVAPESAGMETRLLGEIARLQAQVKQWQAAFNVLQIHTDMLNYANPDYEAIAKHIKDTVEKALKS